MSDTQNPPFAPFQPTAPVPPAEQPPVNPPAGGRKKRSGGSRKKKSAQPEAPAAPTPPASTTRKRKPSTTKRAPKFDLQTILAATAGLKEADMTSFQKGLNLLLDVNKAGRGRVLAALGKVFA